MAEEDKKFTQEDMDKLAGKVREEERRKFEAQAATDKKALETQLADATSKLQDLDKAKVTAADADKILTDLEAGLLAKIPEEKRTLVPDSLSKADKVRFILKNEAHLYGTTTPPAAPAAGNPPGTPPATPPPEKGNKETLPDKFPDGSPFTFEGMNRFASTQPEAYQKYRREGGKLPKS